MNHLRTAPRLRMIGATPLQTLHTFIARTGTSLFNMTTYYLNINIYFRTLKPQFLCVSLVHGCHHCTADSYTGIVLEETNNPIFTQVICLR